MTRTLLFGWDSGPDVRSLETACSDRSSSGRAFLVRDPKAVLPVFHESAKLYGSPDTPAPRLAWQTRTDPRARLGEGLEIQVRDALGRCNEIPV